MIIFNKNIQIALVLILPIFAIAACNNKNENSANKVFSKKTEIQIPASYHPVQGTLNYTSFIGTPDHPTINGGIMNSTDNTPISHDIPTSQEVLPKANDKPVVIPATSIGNSQKPFQDNWATSERVKQLLKEAAQQGKLDFVLKKTDEMGLPASVAVVPMVESNYKNQVVSSKGAAGAWQLMPGTAKGYGIKDSERFQFTTSTVTALKLLNDLHNEFGNWELAFAAYNAGSGRVGTALRKNPQAKSIDELDLPQETKLYVKRIMGINRTIELAANAK